jgi:hypothetical protein
MTDTPETRTISVYIDRSPQEVYNFAADPANVPRWAVGLGTAIEQVNGEWVAQTPDGPVTVRMTEPNPFGIMDHSVRIPSGEEVYNPMRVVPHGAGAVVLFTVFRRPEMTDEQFAQDTAAVERDLRTLKQLLER